MKIALCLTGVGQVHIGRFDESGGYAGRETVDFTSGAEAKKALAERIAADDVAHSKTPVWLNAADIIKAGPGK